jgi:hypothetical protein
MNKTGQMNQVNPHSSRLYRAVLLQGRSPLVSDVQAIELLFCLV